MEVSVSYESDLEKAIEVMKETIEGHPLVVDIRPDPSEGAKVSVMVKALADDGIILKSTVWTRTLDDNFTACSDIRRLLKANFEREGISIPYRHMPCGDRRAVRAGAKGAEAIRHRECSKIL